MKRSPTWSKAVLMARRLAKAGPRVAAVAFSAKSYELFTVGFYAPDGKWNTDSDHSDRESAARRVNYLNGAGQVDAFAAAGRADGGSD